MIEFKKTHSGEIPVYQQILPWVESVAISWVIFTGSADDDKVEAHGAYHWLKHVPFRGTVGFPDGIRAIKGPFVKRGGHIGAWTNALCTSYDAVIHHSQANVALQITTDLWSRPLMTDESINAEREIIFQEIRRKKSSLEDLVYYRLPNLLWPGHPVGHPTLGSIESLRSMAPSMVRRAHMQGYSPNRAVLFVSGNFQGVENVCRGIEDVSSFMPKYAVSERRCPVRYRPAPSWNHGIVSEEETEFTSSRVYVLFPRPWEIPPSMRDLAAWGLLGDLMARGSTSSPLSQIVREKYSLAYNTGVYCYSFPDSGCWGLWVQTSAANIQAAQNAIFEVLGSSLARSPERFQEVKEGIHYGRRMRTIDPEKFNEIGLDRLTYFSEIWSDDALNTLFESIRHEEVINLLDQCTRDSARTIIFKGTNN